MRPANLPSKVTVRANQAMSLAGLVSVPANKDTDVLLSKLTDQNKIAVWRSIQQSVANKILIVKDDVIVGKAKKIGVIKKDNAVRGAKPLPPPAPRGASERAIEVEVDPKGRDLKVPEEAGAPDADLVNGDHDSKSKTPEQLKAEAEAAEKAEEEAKAAEAAKAKAEEEAKAEAEAKAEEEAASEEEDAAPEAPEAPEAPAAPAPPVAPAPPSSDESSDDLTDDNT